LGRKSSKADLPGSSTTLKSATGSSKSSFLTFPSSKQTVGPTSFQNESDRVTEQDENVDDDAIGSGSDDDHAQMHVPNRLRSDSMPGSLPGSVEEASLLEGLRRGQYQDRSTHSGHASNHNPSTDKRDNADDETPGDEDEFPQMDFSSVPVSLLIIFLPYQPNSIQKITYSFAYCSLFYSVSLILAPRHHHIYFSLL
jgi:hypothetical protein